MTDHYKSRARTHADESWGRGHYECAVREIKELRVEVAEWKRTALLARATALEEAARVCEDLDEEASWKEGRLASGCECAAAIREMKERA